MTQQSGLVMAHVAVFFMGIAGVLAGASGFEPWRSTSYRVVFGGVVLFIIWLIAERRKNVQPKKLLLYAGLGVFLSVHWFAFFKSIDLLGVMLGSAMIGIEPLIVAASASLFLKERMPSRYKFGILLTIIGFCALGFGAGLDEPAILEGCAWAVFAFLIFALFVLLNRIWVQKESPILVSAVELLGAIPLTLIMMEGPWLPQNKESWAYALGLGLLCTGLAYGLYNTSMKVISASVAGLLLSLEVVYGMLGGWVIGDRISAMEWIAALFIANILATDIWFYWRYARQRSNTASP